MKSIIASLSSILFLALLALGLGGHDAALAGTSTSTGCVQMSLASGSVTVKADGTFDYVLLVEWNCPTKPFMGQISINPSGTTGVKIVSYDPRYFFPQAASGAILVGVTGAKSAPSGKVNNLVQLAGGGNPSWAFFPVAIP